TYQLGITSFQQQIILCRRKQLGNITDKWCQVTGIGSSGTWSTRPEDIATKSVTVKTDISGVEDSVWVITELARACENYQAMTLLKKYSIKDVQKNLT
ncbi:11342_t:CDS:2, partial [Gigaspora rosea]